MTKNINTEKSKRFLIKHKNGLIVTAIVFLTFIIFDLSPFGGNIHFYSKWAMCGQKPVEIIHAVAGQGIWYQQASSISLLRLGYSEYYCTSLDAENAGYHTYNGANSY